MAPRLCVAENSDRLAGVLTGVDALEALCRRYAFGDVHALLPLLGLPSTALKRVRRLCLFGQRLLELDAEDFDMSDVESGGPEYEALVDRARQCRIPQNPGETNRGALASMRPAYGLLLEVLAARHRRHEMAGLVATAHMIAEYLPILPWEQVWGHAADPMRIGRNAAGRGSHFGRQDSQCKHRRSDRNAAARVLRIHQAPPEGWRTYLDRQHSNVAHAIGICAAACRTPCSIVTRVDAHARQQLTERARIAMAFEESALVRLRHSAPVGHGFGVPSEDEVARTWDHVRTVIGNRGGIGKAVLEEDGYCLPGLPSLISAIAGCPITPSTLLQETAELTVVRLHEALEGGR